MSSKNNSDSIDKLAKSNNIDIGSEKKEKPQQNIVSKKQTDIKHEVFDKLESKLNDDQDIIYHVITRTGSREALDSTQIVSRIVNLLRKEPVIQKIDYLYLVSQAIMNFKNEMKTSEIDEYIASVAESMSIKNPAYGLLASRLSIDNHQKNTDNSFADKMKKLYLRKDVSGKVNPIISKDFYKYVEEHRDKLDKIIDSKYDFLNSYFGLITYIKSYSLRIKDVAIERPQDTYLRVAMSVHMNTEYKFALVNGVYEKVCDIDEELKLIEQAYKLYATKQITQATPTYSNAGTTFPQFSSCFLMHAPDSQEGIMSVASDISATSKWGGGIGVNIHSWRGYGAEISTGGKSSGIIPFLKIYEECIKAFNQRGKRNGSAAIYLFMHHPELLEFLETRIPKTKEDQRAICLFPALWIPDIFMRRVQEDGDWCLFDPVMSGCDLSLYIGEEYTEKYKHLEREKKYTQVLKAREVLQKIYNCQEITGLPYMCFSDTINKYNMQSNLGIIRSSNLCTEIVEYSDEDETAVCNLGSIGLPSFVKDSYNEEELKLPEGERRALCHEFPENPYFDFDGLLNATKVLTICLNKIIDKTFYPTTRSKTSNMRHRPIGIGIQGLADTYIKMRLPFDSNEADILNKHIAETMYYAALSQSTKIAKEIYQKYRAECKYMGKVSVPSYYEGVFTEYTNVEDIPKNAGAYSSMIINGGSHISHGKFHWELYDVQAESLSGRWSWESLREHIKIYGVRNSLLIALMPTSTTSQFMGNNECFEPYTSNLYTRATGAGNFIITNKYLVHDLYKYGLWNDNIMTYLQITGGSIQNIEGIPQHLKDLYKTSYEINQEVLIQQAASRQPFVDQAQSLNWFVENLTFGKFNSLLFKAWKLKLKTGKYYLYSRSSVNPTKFTIDPENQAALMANIKEKKLINVSNDVKYEHCDSCSA
jgi:ribonucleoside-diphosphate reductase alpha chain